MLRLRSLAAWATLACALTVLLTASVWLGDSTTELAINFIDLTDLK